jgi:hypothetical protein
MVSSFQLQPAYEGKLQPYTTKHPSLRHGEGLHRESGQGLLLHPEQILG